MLSQDTPQHFADQEQEKFDQIRAWEKLLTEAVFQTFVVKQLFPEAESDEAAFGKYIGETPATGYNTDYRAALKEIKDNDDYSKLRDELKSVIALCHTENPTGAQSVKSARVDTLITNLPEGAKEAIGHFTAGLTEVIHTIRAKKSKN